MWCSVCLYITIGWCIDAPSVSQSCISLAKEYLAGFRELVLWQCQSATQPKWAICLPPHRMTCPPRLYTDWLQARAGSWRGDREISGGARDLAATRKLRRVTRKLESQTAKGQMAIPSRAPVQQPSSSKSELWKSKRVLTVNVQLLTVHANFKNT